MVTSPGPRSSGARVLHPGLDGVAGPGHHEGGEGRPGAQAVPGPAGCCRDGGGGGHRGYRTDSMSGPACIGHQDRSPPIRPRPTSAGGRRRGRPRWWRPARSVGAGCRPTVAGVYWSESRPTTAAARWWCGPGPGLPRVDVSPAAVSVRSRVHEYGGGAATVVGGVLFYVDQADQRWYRWRDRWGVGPRRPSRPSRRPTGPSPPLRRRAADPVGAVAGLGRGAARRRPTATEHRLVALAVDGSLAVVPLVEGRDFVAAPRPSPDGRWLAWVAWDHPSMPWDSSELWVARLEDVGRHRSWASNGRRVAGGGESRWASPAGAGREPAVRRRPDRAGGCRYRLAIRGVAATVAGPALGRPAGRVPRARLGARPVDHGRAVRRLHRVPDARDGRDQLVRLRPPDRLHRHRRDSDAGVDAVIDQPWSLEVVDQPC